MQQEELKNDAFRRIFKYYKQKQPPPDLSGVINFRDESSFEKHGIRQDSACVASTDLNYAFHDLGLQPINNWKVFTIHKHSGLYFISNPFTESGVQHWIERSFENYCLPPNPTNIKENVDLNNCQDYTILQKLRWATLGYHHNWDTKEYDESSKGEFPLDLNLLSSIIAQSIGFLSFKAEAAIVNYYALDSSIGGHTDHSERNHEAPLISISFGQTAIFLLGGADKSVVPTPLFIQNGDIVIMSSATRLCYHAVPKIVTDPEFVIKGRWSSIMSKMRLNLNVRQVNL
ncbi:nucleic acid dioxygenase ALKBH1-like [Daphnia pulex]|uniref:nucleic acid dioxygenase ALKBH1-like n=1 Tax=Daphnia pulex TaxID=6669 RepID=UPI001EE1510A|nr:nucleic acid dioxygenase ALKBH1-like [Daphnia pulex]XP_046462693.1 nucleic acid dioxygenase ALKBH1-like [Daphnia pulex]XP_046462694.1 nucleic acid dioxygenase ALKBH1-like [Daphnia pulex]